MSEWIAVADRMPEPGARVLFAYRNELGNARVSAGYWISKFFQEAEDSDFEGTVEYHEERDTYYLPAGWIEEGWETEYRADIRDPVTHWMPMPRHPEEQAT